MPFCEIYKISKNVIQKEFFYMIDKRYLDKSMIFNEMFEKVHKNHKGHIPF